MKNNTRLIYLLAIIKFVLPYILVHPYYQPHRDEFLYLAEGHHLAWGFMEVHYVICYGMDNKRTRKWPILDQVLARYSWCVHFYTYCKDHCLIRRENIRHHTRVYPFYINRLHSLIYFFSS